MNFSALSSSDNIIPDRKNSGFKKSLKVSKQNFMEHKVFGSKRKGILIGKKFKKFGKGTTVKSPSVPKMSKSSGISPDLEDFDSMMASVTKGKGSGKKSLFGKNYD